MLLRRMTQHVKDQNWFAVVIDFLIVVLGVLVATQVSNWNSAREFKGHERVLLRELRVEAVRNIADTQAKAESFGVGAAAARRVLVLSESESPSCGVDCWPVVADLMHASQWQQVNVSWSTFDEMRREGLPSNRQIIPAIEEFQFVTSLSANTLSVPPPYRTMVRRRIQIALQDAYWNHCYSLNAGLELYLDPCPKPEGIVVDPAAINSILSDSEIMSALREWTSVARVISEALAEQHTRSDAILAAIDDNPKARP